MAAQAGPFTGGGDPSLELLTSAARLGIPMAPFPFTAAGHVIHLGRGSLAAVHAAGDRSHPFYEWAEDHHDPHFEGSPARISVTRPCFRNSARSLAR